MTLAQSLIAFVPAAGLLTLAPGVDTALVLRTAAAEGSRRAILAACGIGLGCLIWGAAVALGLGALVSASRAAFTVLKWIGAGYLAYLGLRLLLSPRASLTVGPDDTSMQDPFRRGLLTNLLNPKVGAFYVSFLPGFVPIGAPMAPFIFLLACIHVALSAVWFWVLIASTAPLGRWLARSSVMKTLDRVTGCVFIAFGARLALSKAS
jgi:threonine/homoserine/homoserine lactone efflux protein